MKKYILMFAASLLFGGAINTAQAQITSLSELSNNKTYKIHNARGYWGTSNNQIVKATEKDSKEFAIISYNGNYFLYSVSDKKFVNYNKDLTSTYVTEVVSGTVPTSTLPVIIENGNTDSSHPNTFVFHFVSPSGNVYINDSGSEIVINTYSSFDAGNRNYITEASSSFDATEALNILQNPKDALNSYLGLSPATSLSDGGLYYIVNPYGGYPNKQNGKYCAMVYDAKNPDKAMWGLIGTDEINTNINYVYEAKQVDGGWAFYNIIGGTYIDKSVNSMTTASKTPTIAHTLTEYKNMGDGSFRIQNTTTGNYCLYPDASAYGGNKSNQIGSNNWSIGLENGALSYWRFYPITDAMQNVIQKAIDSIKNELKQYENTAQYVFGMTSENYNKAKSVIDSLSADKNRMAEILAVHLDDYTTKLTTGYYRIQNYYWGNQDRSHSILRAKADRSLYADMPQDGDETKKDISTVFRIEVPSGQEASLEPKGLKITTQGRSLVSTSGNTYNNDDQVIDETDGNDKPIAELIKPSDTELNIAERGLHISDKDGNYNNKSYYYKKSDGNNPARYVAGWSGIANTSRWNLIPAKDIIVEMHSATESDASTYATLYAPFAVTLPDGLKAYTGTIKTTENESTLTLSEIESTVIPAGTPVILIGSATSYTLDIAADNNSDAIESDLTGQYLGDTETVSGVYTLGAVDNNVGFYQYKGNIKANKARLKLDNSNASKGFAFSFGNDDPTGINNATVSEGATLKVGDVIYDLQGRRVKDAKRGIYIINGKKVQVK